MVVTMLGLVWKAGDRKHTCKQQETQSPFPTELSDATFN
jgi:hypothetical protein